MRGQSCWSVDHNSRNEAVDVPFSTKQNSSGHQNVTFAMFSSLEAVDRCFSIY